MEHITLSKEDLDKIQNVVDEFKIQYFELIRDSNGIGYTLDISFWTGFKGHLAQVTIPLVTNEDW